MSQVQRYFTFLYIKAYQFAPGVSAMKGNPGYRNWAERVVALSNLEELAPIQRVLKELASGQLLDLDPLWRFVDGDAFAIPFQCYANASRLAERETKTNACAAFVLALVALAGWSACLRERLLGQEEGLPHIGWTCIPYAYIDASLKLGDLEGAQALVTVSYNTLQAAKYPEYEPIPDALRKYRALSIKVYQCLDAAVSNLADDLYQSLSTSPENFRAEFFALLWTLGLIPESQLVHTPSFLPSRSFVKRVVWACLDHIPYDPLTQYIWLEMKDKPPFNLRGHRPLFDKINLRYSQYIADVLWPIPPSQIYAQTLIAWFKGSLTLKEVGLYTSIIEPVQMHESIRHDHDRADWSVFLRIFSLACILSRQFDGFVRDVSLAEERDIWLSLWSQVVGIREKFHLNPGGPDLAGTLNCPLFQVIEGDLGVQAADDPWPATIGELIEALEEYRAAAMSYSLAVTPPIPGVDEAAALEEACVQEGEMLQWLRGAYFLVYYEYLPEHFRRYTTDFDAWMGGADPGKNLNRNTGLKEYETVLNKLQELYKDLEPIAPVYAGQRLKSYVSIERIVNALNSHAIGAGLSGLNIHSKDRSLDRKMPGSAVSIQW
jgi:hypothetical protein